MSCPSQPLSTALVIFCLCPNWVDYCWCINLKHVDDLTHLVGGILSITSSSSAYEEHPLSLTIRRQNNWKIILPPKENTYSWYNWGKVLHRLHRQKIEAKGVQGWGLSQCQACIEPSLRKSECQLRAAELYELYSLSPQCKTWLVHLWTKMLTKIKSWRESLRVIWDTITCEKAILAIFCNI